MDKLKVLLVGCGNIAGKFDMSPVHTDWPYTHAGAYRVDGRFSVEACIDPNESTRHEFMEYWGISKGFDGFDQVKSFIGEFDVISICSPTEFHKNDVLSAIQLKPKLIFCEKPVTQYADDSRLLADKCRESNILLAINHTRRWDPKVEELKNDIEHNIRGQLRSVIATYNKGILNNGSHLLDLMHYLFGDLNIEMTANKVFDYLDDDPSVSALLTTSTGIPVHCVVGHAGDFALFEVQFIFATGILSMRDGGLSWNVRSLVESDHFAGYKVLNKGEDIEGHYKLAMRRAVDNIYQALVTAESLASNGESAYKAQKMCEKIKCF